MKVVVTDRQPSRSFDLEFRFFILDAKRSTDSAQSVRVLQSFVRSLSHVRDSLYTNECRVLGPDSLAWFQVEVPSYGNR